MNCRIERWRGQAARAALPWLLAGACAVSAAEPLRPAARDSEAAAALWQQVVGEDPSSAWSWAAALAAVGGDRSEVAAFQRGLFDLVLSQAAGDGWPRGATVASVVEAGQRLRPLQADLDSHRRYQQVLQRLLVPQWPREPVPPPTEIEALGAQLESISPGLWRQRGLDGRPRNLIWQLVLENRAAMPLAPQALTLRLALPGQPALEFQCPPQRGEAPWAQPGQRWTLLCRSRESPADGVAGWDDTRRRLAAGEAPPVEWFSPELLRQGGADALIAVLTQAAPNQTARYAAAFAACERRNRCAEETRPAAVADRPPGPGALGPGDPARAAAGADPAWPEFGARHLARTAAAAIALFMAFAFVARAWGERRAASAMALLLLVPMAWAARGFGTASALLVPAALAAALLATGLMLLGYWLYDAMVFSRFGAPGAGPPARRRRRPGG